MALNKEKLYLFLYCHSHCSISDGVTGIFHLYNPSGRTTTLELTQPLKEMSTRSISWG
jgi:hypothetical protein